jgi:transcriptional regulator with XRE-family HTH domain
MSTAEQKRGYEKLAGQFATNVRNLRRRTNATLQEIATRSGLSISTLSKIERGQLSPTYETLLRLADGLQVDIAELFAGGTADAPLARRSVTRRGHGKLHVTKQYRYEIFCTNLFRKQFTPLVTTITARSIDEFLQLPRHTGEEFIYVIAGVVELHTERYEPIQLRHGDGCYFDSRMSHACISVSKSDAVILWIASRARGPSRRPARAVSKHRTSSK